MLVNTCGVSIHWMYEQVGGCYCCLSLIIPRWEFLNNLIVNEHNHLQRLASTLEIMKK